MTRNAICVFLSPPNLIRIYCGSV